MTKNDIINFDINFKNIEESIMNDVFTGDWGKIHSAKKGEG